MLVAFVTTTSFPAGAQQWTDPENTTFGEAVQLDNSADGLRTEFTIGSDRTTIGWQDLQQPADNTLVFTFSNPSDQSAVLNYIGARFPSSLNGTVECAGGTCAFSNPFGIYVGDEALLDVGNLALIAGEVDRQEFLSNGAIGAQLDGFIRNAGTIRADGNVVLLGREIVNEGEIQTGQGFLLMLAGEEIEGLEWERVEGSDLAQADFDARLSGGRVENNGLLEARDAALISSRVANHGQIEIAEGSLLIIGADAVSIRHFDNPVEIRLPRTDVETRAAGEEIEYAIENHGRIDAGLGHVRLSAADPLGYGIRQGATGSITAGTVEVAGGETGRVQLSGEIDAREDAASGLGGDVDVTGSVIVLADAHLDASGSGGGGTIEIGGEQQGQGDLQRARAVVIDEASSVRADALESGDGGRVIVFSEVLTSIDGALSATGGPSGGDGGFIETSGLARFAISQTPDVSAPEGQAGGWLIDPFDITIVAAADPSVCDVSGSGPCMNDAIEAILDPNFDDAVFDGILRTVATSEVDAEIIAKALAVGTDITLSTQAFGIDTGEDAGNITVSAPILIPNTSTLAGTTARLTLLAAGNIILDEDIIAGTPGEDPNLALTIVLRANDASQNDPIAAFSYDRIRGDVVFNADIDTGGGDLDAQGIAVHQAAGTSIRTSGGNVSLRSGSFDIFGDAFTIVRGAGTPGIRPEDDPAEDPFAPAALSGYAPVAISIEGAIDTSQGNDTGGDIAMTTNSVNVSLGGRTDVVTSQLTIAPGATLTTGGGDIALAGGRVSAQGTSFAGNVQIEGSLDTTCAAGGCNGPDVGGNISIAATHIDPATPATRDFVEADPAEAVAREEGGRIAIDLDGGSLRTGGGTLSIGDTATRSVAIDGLLDTRNLASPDENGLLSIRALDQLAIDAAASEFGDGQITIGAQRTTTLASGGISIEGRSVTTSDAIGAHATTLLAIGSSSAELGETRAEELRIEGHKSVDLGVSTLLRSEDVRIAAATRPTEQTEAERSTATTEPALHLRGNVSTATSGVRIEADRVEIRTGDGITPTANLFAGDLGTPSEPTDLALARLAFGSYSGLQLASLASDLVRPEAVTIAQDAALLIANDGAIASSEIGLEGAFGVATIGENGLDITLESSDGVLTLADAGGLNSAALVLPDSDAGRSRVTLLGGLLLPDAPVPAVPSPDAVRSENSVVFGDGLTPLTGPAAFAVDSLVVSTPGDFTLTAQTSQSIASARELVFEAGRATGVEGAAGRGSLILDEATVIQAGETLSLRAGASGFGDLVFDPAAAIELNAHDITLRAGAGATSLNPDASKQSRITGLGTNVTIRDAAGNAFGADAAAEMAFRFQQDAAIDAATDLPSLAQFGLLEATGFRDTRDVVYSVRSDKGSIDLDDGDPLTNDGDRFRDAALRLVGLEAGAVPAIVVASDFSFEGDSVELGGIGGFRFTQILANAFGRSNTNPDARITLRSGVGGSGNLSFEAGTEVVAGRIDLIAGDGAGGGTGSIIDARGATFDLGGATPGGKTFVYQQDAAGLLTGSLPTLDQFVGGLAGAPDVLAIRSDSGELAFDNLDFAALPIDTTGTVRRLVLEADSIRLTRTDGNDLDLESPGGLRLRLRTNDLFLTALTGEEDAEGGRVLAGSSNPTTAGNDAAFDAHTLLIEGFDPESEIATVANLSALSADAEGAVDFDLGDGRGPASITIDQNGSVEIASLPDGSLISGQLGRTLSDDDEDEAIATLYSITSRFGSVALDPSKVNGSNLVVFGAAATGAESAIRFAAGDYVLDGLSALTGESIRILENTSFDVAKRLALTAGFVGLPTETVVSPLGSLVFESTGGTRTIRLSAHQIALTAGPPLVLTSPDGPDEGFERDEIDPDFLPSIDLAGLAQISLNPLDGNPDGSSITLTQNASLDLATDANGDFVPDALAALVDGAGPDPWERLQIESIQGDITLAGIDDLSTIVESLSVRSGPESTLVVDLEDQPVLFDAYAGTVVFQSNDITLKTGSATTQLDLASPNLELRSTIEIDSRIRQDRRFRLRDDPDSLDRAIVRIQQVADFDASAALPLAGQYILESVFVDQTGNLTTRTLPRSSLGSLDIELSTTGLDQTLTLDNALRDRVLGSNLILKSASDVAIDLSGAPPGFGEIDAAALQLGSLDIRTDFDFDAGTAGGGQIFFSIAGFPTPGQTASSFDPPALSTLGDQRFDGRLVLATLLVDRGRDITFTGDITTSAGAGLELRTGGEIRFEGNLGTGLDPLDHLTVLFENRSSSEPNVEFGRRVDEDGDGIAEAPVFSSQSVTVANDIVFRATSAGATTPVVRTLSALFATIGKASGDLTFNSQAGDFVMGSGEKLSVGGRATINALAGEARLGDVAALELDVRANSVALVRRATGIYLDSTGETQSDSGPMIVANRFSFKNGLDNPIVPSLVGSGKEPVFGVPNPFDPSLPAFLNGFAVFQIHPDGRPLSTADFVFTSRRPDLLDQIPVPVPIGPSRSDLSRAFGPREIPSPERRIPEPLEIRHPDRLEDLGVVVRPTPPQLRVAQLKGAAIIDDLALGDDRDAVLVTKSRLDARDADAAIELYQKLFGPEGERVGDVREVLQSALDRYLEETRARRVIGFELRRFVKNRPSTLIEAYQTLESLDTLFRYHRRLGLSPGEFREIQLEWLKEIQPQGISLDELSEAIHPSRYVRGSDILDIFGQ